LFFVGHISIAFILTYFIIKRYPVPNLSISLVLFLSIVPDIDILFSLLGVEVVHRSISHSLIVFIIVLFVFILKYRIRSIMIYFLAYLSHSAIGDLIVGPANLFPPFGIYYLNSGIYYKTPEHFFIECLVLTVMAIIVIIQYLCNRKRNMIPIKYSKKIDPIFYPILIASIIMSAAYLLNQFQEFKFPDSFFSVLQSFDYIKLIVVIHTVCISIVFFVWIVSWYGMRMSNRQGFIGIDERKTLRN